MNNMKWLVYSLSLATLMFVSNATANDQTSSTTTATNASQRKVKEADMTRKNGITKKTMRNKIDGNHTKAIKDTSSRTKPGDPPWMRAPKSNP